MGEQYSSVRVFRSVLAEGLAGAEDEEDKAASHAQDVTRLDRQDARHIGGGYLRSSCPQCQNTLGIRGAESASNPCSKPVVEPGTVIPPTEAAEGARLMLSLGSIFGMSRKTRDLDDPLPQIRVGSWAPSEETPFVDARSWIG